MPNVVEYDCTEHGIDAVTLYQANCAQVKRTIRVKLRDGQNEVRVKNLPTSLDRDVIRVDGTRNAVVSDVIYCESCFSRISSDLNCSPLITQTHQSLMVLSRLKMKLSRGCKTRKNASRPHYVSKMTRKPC